MASLGAKLNLSRTDYFPVGVSFTFFQGASRYFNMGVAHPPRIVHQYLLPSPPPFSPPLPPFSPPLPPFPFLNHERHAGLELSANWTFSKKKNVR